MGLWRGSLFLDVRYTDQLLGPVNTVQGHQRYKRRTMNDQLSNALAEILKTSKDGIINMALFAQQQAPELAKEVIQWGFWSNLVWVIVSPIVIGICYKLCLVGIKIKKDDDFSTMPMMIFVGCGILFIIFILTFFCSLQELIKCLVAPKLYMIDYVKDLLKPSSK